MLAPRVGSRESAEQRQGPDASAQCAQVKHDAWGTELWQSDPAQRSGTDQCRLAPLGNPTLWTWTFCLQVQGRAERLAYQDTFVACYQFRLLFQAGTQYPILGAVRMAHPGGYEVYKRRDVSYGVEEYLLCDTFPEAPTSADVAAALAGKKRSAPLSLLPLRGCGAEDGFLTLPLAAPCVSWPCIARSV